MDEVEDTFLYKAKVDAAKLAREMLSKPDMVIWDTETTGLRNARIVTIGAINLQGEILLDLLMNPEIRIESGASAVHGIFDMDVAERLPFRDHVIQIWDVLQRGPWTVYNLQYDRPILAQQLSQCALTQTSTYLDAYDQRHAKKLGDYCAMEAFADFYGEWNDYRGNFRWKKLTEACDYLGIAGIDDPAHSAIGDCRRTLAVLQAMDRWLAKEEMHAA